MAPVICMVCRFPSKFIVFIIYQTLNRNITINLIYEQIIYSKSIVFKRLNFFTSSLNFC